MNAINELVPLLNTLPHEERAYLVSLAKADASLFKEALQEMLRLQHIAKIGDKDAWKEWEHKQNEYLQTLLQDLETRKKD